MSSSGSIGARSAASAYAADGYGSWPLISGGDHGASPHRYALFNFAS
jgi:hypothetical protein